MLRCPWGFDDVNGEKIWQSRRRIAAGEKLCDGKRRGEGHVKQLVDEQPPTNPRHGLNNSFSQHHNTFKPSPNEIPDFYT